MIPASGIWIGFHSNKYILGESQSGPLKTSIWSGEWGIGFKKWIFLQNFALLCVDLDIMYPRICVVAAASIVLPQFYHRANMSSLDSLKHHHFMDKSRLRGATCQKSICIIINCRPLCRIWEKYGALQIAQCMEVVRCPAITQEKGELFSAMKSLQLSHFFHSQSHKVVIKATKLSLGTSEQWRASEK